MKVSYLGPVGTYSEEAARQLFGERAQYVPAETIDDVLRQATQEATDAAVLPIENSTEGAVHRTLDLLRETSLQICAEVYVPIHHQLITQASQPQDITVVFAHPQALAQCHAWLQAHLPIAKQTSASSNAQAVILAGQNSTYAAIAGKRAAEVYDIPVLASDIEDEANNTTRFLALAQKDSAPTGHDKTSLLCSIANKPGTLYELLGVFARNGVNMTKIESRPMPGRLWEYLFYIDIDGHRLDAAKCLEQLPSATTSCKILGSYRSRMSSDNSSN